MDRGYVGLASMCVAFVKMKTGEKGNKRRPLRDVAYEYFDKQPNKHITVVAVAAFSIYGRK